jgi:hypothetical protein
MHCGQVVEVVTWQQRLVDHPLVEVGVEGERVPRLGGEVVVEVEGVEVVVPHPSMAAAAAAGEVGLQH